MTTFRSAGGQQPAHGPEHGQELANFAVRIVPFDEWLDVDTLLHRSSVTSGDFDYVLRPLCPDCGSDLALEYETLEIEGGADPEPARDVITALICYDCRQLWERSEDDDD